MTFLTGRLTARHLHLVRASQSAGAAFGYFFSEEPILRAAPRAGALKPAMILMLAASLAGAIFLTI
jgi:hypothetical protein